jgi:hypothetical protein
MVCNNINISPETLDIVLNYDGSKPAGINFLSLLIFKYSEFNNYNFLETINLIRNEENRKRIFKCNLEQKFLNNNYVSQFNISFKNIEDIFEYVKTGDLENLKLYIKRIDIFEDDELFVKFLFVDSPVDLEVLFNCRNEAGDPIIFYALFTQNEDMLDYILEQGGSLRTIDMFNLPVLFEIYNENTVLEFRNYVIEKCKILDTDYHDRIYKEYIKLYPPVIY